MKIFTTITDPNHPNFGQTTETEYPDPPKEPLVLSATRFMDTAIAGLKTANNSTQAAAEARFIDIIEVAKNFTDVANVERAKRVRYVHERYTKATTFNKAVVTGMLALFRAAGVASITAGEESGILAAWPEG